MTTKVGLMGFGRIGRNLFRILYKRDDIQVTAVSDVADHKNLEYLLKYDTIMGRFPDVVSVSNGALYTYGRQVKMLSGREPGDVKWGELGVDVVVEATARYRSRAELKKHLDAGAKRVILCVPPLDEPDITVLMGVNDHQLKAEHRIISNGSVTAHCAAPIISIIDSAFGISACSSPRCTLTQTTSGWRTCRRVICAARAPPRRTSFPPIPTRRGCSRK